MALFRMNHECRPRPRHLMRVGLAVVTIAVTCLILAVGATPSPDQRVATIRFGGPSPGAPAWLWMVAQEKGFYRANRVDVRMTFTPGGVQLLVGGNLDIYYTNGDQPAIAMNRGADMVGISDMINSPYSLLVTRQISSFADVRGKKVGVSVVGSADSAVVLGMLAKGGVSFNDVDVIQTGGNVNKVAALSRDAVQAVSLLQPFDLQALRTIDGVKRLAFSSSSLRITGLSVMAHGTWAKKNPRAVVGFLRAHLQARDWLADPRNAEEAINIFLKYNTGVTRPDVEPMYDLYRALRLFPSAVAPKLPGVAQFYQLATLAGVGEFKQPQAYYKLVYFNQALKEHRKSK